MKNSGSFHISALNIDCEYLLEPPRSVRRFWRVPTICFWAEIRKLMYTPVLLYKNGLKEVKQYRHAFLMLVPDKAIFNQ